MLTIEKAKAQAATLAEYLLTVGKRVKHTHALEAIARINGHKSWNTFQSEVEEIPPAPQTGLDLAALFNSGAVHHVELGGVRYKVAYFNSEALGSIEEILAGNNDDYDIESIGVELLRFDGGDTIDLCVSVGDIGRATFENGHWTMPDGTALTLFAEKPLS